MKFGLFKTFRYTPINNISFLFLGKNNPIIIFSLPRHTVLFPGHVTVPAT